VKFCISQGSGVQHNNSVCVMEILHVRVVNLVLFYGGEKIHKSVEI